MAAAIDPRLGHYSHSPAHQSIHPLPPQPQPQPQPSSQHHHISHQQHSLSHSPSQHSHLPPLSHTLHHSSAYQPHLPLQRSVPSPSGYPYYGHANSHPHPHPQPLQTAHSSVDDSLENDEGSVGDLASPNEGSAHDETSPIGASSFKGSDAKRPRACDSCRGLKVKCIIDPASGEPCKRCAKASRQCIVTPPTRKRQKKADGRVAELERKIDALTATLAQRDGKAPPIGYSYAVKRELDSYESSPASQSGEFAASPPRSNKRLRLEKVNMPPSAPADSAHHAYASQALLNGNKHEPVMAGSADDPTLQVTPTSGSIYNQQIPRVYDHSNIDIKLDAIIPPQEADRLFYRYVTDIVPHFPAVPFAPGTTAQEIRKTKPILFLAILSGTSYGADIHVDIQVALERELRNVFAECLWKNGEKSLQLIQALQVGALWYRPPANFEQHMCYQLIHTATIMGIDIGIGKRQNPWRKKFFNRDSKFKASVPAPESVESRRAWLVNYFLCVTIAMILRRPILLRFNDFMRECLEILESSEDALPSDKVLCQHIRLARISEEIAIQFAMDDPAVNLTISDGKVSYGIKHHEEGLAELRARNVLSPAIQLSSHITNLYLHEIALHSQSTVADFKAPFTEETFRAAVSQAVLGPSHVDALIECQNSCHNVVETFLSIDFEVIFVLPVIFSVRIIYAVVVLIKLYISATSPGEIANVIKAEDLHIEENLSKLEKSFACIVERDQLSPHTKFLFVMQRLCDRFRNIKQRQTPPKTGINTVDRVQQTSKSAEPSRKPISRPSSASGAQQAQGLHLLSEVAMSGNSGSPSHHHNGGSSSAPAATPIVSGSPMAARAAVQQQQHQQQHQHQPQPHPHAQPHSHQQQGWYQTSPAATDMTMPMDGLYDYPGQLTDFEGLDYGLAGLGVDGPITGLFMDGGWIGSNPGAFFGWNS